MRSINCPLVALRRVRPIERRSHSATQRIDIATDPSAETEHQQYTDLVDYCQLPRDGFPPFNAPVSKLSLSVGSFAANAVAVTRDLFVYALRGRSLSRRLGKAPMRYFHVAGKADRGRSRSRSLADVLDDLRTAAGQKRGSSHPSRNITGLHCRSPAGRRPKLASEKIPKRNRELNVEADDEVDRGLFRHPAAIASSAPL